MEKELKNVELLTYSNWWDGPLCGLALYKKEYYHYSILDEGLCRKAEEGEEIIFYNEDNVPFTYDTRTWKLYKIEPWQLAYELFWHAVFSTNVATYTDFDKKLVNERFKINKRKTIFRNPFKYSPPSFYDMQKKDHKEIDYSNNECIGWVSEKNIKLQRI